MSESLATGQFLRRSSLTALQCFECAGWHLNFTHAAEELHLTQSAVSHRIRTLEEQLGYINVRALSRNKRDGLDKCIRYLSNNRNRLRYEQALAAGLPIATGVIEGACRHLINDRLDITDARWSLAGAEALLKLRSIYSSGDWEQYIKLHRQQAKKRHYEHCTELAQAA